MKKFIPALFLVMLFILSGCGKQASEDTNVGIILPLSGVAANYGESAQRGITIAHEELKNTFPHLNVNVYYEDSAFKPKEGLNAYNKLISTNNINAVITAASHISLSIQPLAHEADILQMAIFASARKYTSPNDLSFRTSPRSEIEVVALADFIKSQGFQKIGIMYLNVDYAVDSKDILKELLQEQSIVQVIGDEGYIQEDSDFKTSLLKLKSENPDAIFLVGTAKHYAMIIKQAEELDINTQFLSMRAAENPELITNAGELADGLIYTYPFDATGTNQEIKKFVQSFEEKYGQLPDAYAAEGYEGFKLTALAFNECGKDYICIQEYLTKLEDYDSIFGKLSFDENGDVYYDFFYKTIQDGKFVPLA